MYTVEHVISTMGGGRVLAAKLDIDESNCSQWIAKGNIPSRRVVKIFELSCELNLGLELFLIPMYGGDQ